MEGLCDIYTFEGFAVHRIVYIHVLLVKHFEPSLFINIDKVSQESMCFMSIFCSTSLILSLGLLVLDDFTSHTMLHTDFLFAFVFQQEGGGPRAGGQGGQGGGGPR